MQDLKWSCLNFEQLSPALLYSILQLRAEVFVVEQKCVYQDPDGYDQQALHVIGRLNEDLVCYTRILPPGLKYQGPAIGRVVTSHAIRGSGYGAPLVQKSIGYCRQHWPDAAVHVSAQQYLEKFYIKLGFATVSEMYLEDEIPHIEMVLKIDQ